MTPPKLQIDANGWVRGITHHRSPFYTPGGMSVPRGVHGLVVHTMVGNLPGTDNEFMNTHYSSHFGTGQDGSIIQWVDITGGAAEAQADGNSGWYSIEDADNQNPRNPFTPAQLNRIAQVLELTSRVGNFPLQLTSSPSGEGLGWHGMGGVAWGNHPDCPGSVRRAQFPAILAVAKAIRSGAPDVRSWTAAGQLTLAALASGKLHVKVSTVLRTTVEFGGEGVFAPNLAKHVNAVFAGDSGRVPAGVKLFYPVSAGVAEWTTQGQLSLSALASGQLHARPADVLAATAVHSPGGLYTADAAAYINDVFARTSIKVPAGVVLHY